MSPYVAGQVVKGPTDLFMQAVGRPSTAAGVASLYEGLIDGMVCDEDDPDPPPTDPDGGCPTLMDGAPAGRGWPASSSTTRPGCDRPASLAT